MTENEKIAAHINVLSAAVKALFRLHADRPLLRRAFDEVLSIQADAQLFSPISEEAMAHQATIAEHLRVLLDAALD